MKLAALILVALCLIGIVAFLALRGRMGENPDAGGFVDWVKNPNYKASTEDYFAARDALTVPEDISQSEIQAMVERLFVKADNDFNMDKLRLVGGKATPQLVAALNEDRTFNMTFSEGGHVFDAKSPFERICDLLKDICPPEAAKPLARYASHQDKYFRKQAAVALGNIGTGDCIEPIVELLDDRDDYVRSYAMMGIKRGIRGKRCTDDFLDAVFPALETLLDRDDSSASGAAPKLMLSINRDRAIPVMLSEKYFSNANEKLHYIIEAFNEKGVPIPLDKLLPLISTLQPLVDDYPHDYDLAAALIAYANNPDTNTEAFLTNQKESKIEKVAESAADGLSILSGVTDPSGFVFALLQERGWDNLTPPQKNYYCVLIYDGEVNNGGHSQYFVNSSGNRHSRALDGLRAIGANKRVAILADALQLFGSNGPSPENDKRHQQLAAFSSHQDTQLDSLDSRYYACDESIDVLLSSYALKNREHFSQLR